MGTTAPSVHQSTLIISKDEKMKKNLRNRIIAASVGAALLLGPTAAFADTTPAPTSATAPTKTKVTSADQAAYKAALAAYRVALKAWQE